MWTNFFDRIFLISLINNTTGRLFKTLQQLQNYDVEVEIFEATYNEKSGVIGLRDTMIRLFNECLDKEYSNVLVLEDDILILEDINYYMPLCLQQLPNNYDLCYLGAYIIKPFKERYSENLLLLNKALTTHAVAYPKKTIEKLLPVLEMQSSNPRDVTPIDITYINRVVSEGKSYITYPLLISQRNGFSSIEGKEVDYKKYIEGGYTNMVKKLL